MARHINLPVFIPHEGCPNDCVFCNQRTISGTRRFDITSVPAQIKERLTTLPDSDTFVELAYFGGSFTGLERCDMRFLLDIARRHLDAGKIHAVRVSTRPDYIDGDIIAELKKGGVSTVELGVQSMCDRVLTASGRGHAASDTIRAFGLLKAAGFSVVGQMMIGLPASTGADEVETARRICEMGADAARVYPLAVLRGTALERMTARGEYSPLSADAMIRRTADVLEVFADFGVKVIRVGLCASEELADGVAVGNYPPALGEMAMSEVYLRRIKAALNDAAVNAFDLRRGQARVLRIMVPRGAISKAAGHHGVNKSALCNKSGFKDVKFIENADLPEYTVKITR